MVVLVSSSDNGGKPCRVPITINDFLILDDVRLPGWTIGATHGAGARFIGGPLRLSVPRITAVALRVVYVRWCVVLILIMPAPHDTTAYARAQYGWRKRGGLIRLRFAVVGCAAPSHGMHISEKSAATQQPRGNRGSTDAVLGCERRRSQMPRGIRPRT
jgi:hypothetical protein